MTTKRALKSASGAAPIAVEEADGTVTTEMHDPITWLDIRPDGTEYRRTGRIWEHAPALSGAGKAWWVLPETVIPGEPSAMLVVRAGRRHRVGRPVKHPKREGATVWQRDGGRYVDKGEFYRETDPRSRCAHVESGGTAERGWSLPGLIMRETVEVTNYLNWLRICEARAERQESDRA